MNTLPWVWLLDRSRSPHPHGGDGTLRPVLRFVLVYRWFDVNVYRKSTDGMTTTR